MGVMLGAEHTFLPEMQKPFPRYLKLTIFLIFVALSIFLVLSREQWLMRMGDFLYIRDHLEPADIIQVVAGDDYRTDYAIQLYKKGYGKKLFFTGGWCDIHHYWHGEHAKERSLAQGVPLDAIVIDDSKVLSTYMEAERLRDWIAKSPDPVYSVIVVSDPFHMRRAQWAYQNIFGNSVKVLMAPVPFELTPYQHTWWKDPKSRGNVWEEYTKFIYNLLRYRYSWGFFKDWLASLDTE
jgi:uncharacterized SAM-binding protein YcdF (DUF218 family)